MRDSKGVSRGYWSCFWHNLLHLIQIVSLSVANKYLFFVYDRYYSRCLDFRQLKHPLFLGIEKKAVNFVLVLQILTDLSEFLDQ